MKWITVNEFISLDGIAANFANNEQVRKRHEKLRDIMNHILWLHDFYPDELKQVSNLMEFIKTKDKMYQEEITKAKKTSVK
ncbi:MAG TPA: hypothetical protein VMR76_01000 [Candidatus Saccharimonadia bacterium]|nr:hypothetical protein [Candidatus Saccharimonadia bacterium]